MHIRLSRPPKHFILACSIALLTGIVAYGRTQEQTRAKEAGTQSRPIVLVVPNFEKASDMDVVRLRNGVERQRYLIRRTLLDQLRDDKLTPPAKTETISLLGAYRDNETVAELIRNINFVAVRRSDETDFATGRRGGYIARYALTHIGSPSEQVIFKIIGTRQATDASAKTHPELRAYGFESSKLNGFATVLAEIEGTHYALLKLQDAQSKVKNPAIKAQFQAIIERVKIIEAGRRLEPNLWY